MVACVVVLVLKLVPIFWLSSSHHWKFYFELRDWIRNQFCHSFKVILPYEGISFKRLLCMPWVLLLKQGNKKTLQWSWWKANQWNGDCCFCLKRSTGLIFFFMTVMGKIYIISSADPLLGLLLVARKCYILIICVPHVDLTLCNLLLCRGRETKCAYFQGAGPFQPSALRREW